jgi:hypothetical protein
MEVSGERYLYDREGEWLVSSMSTVTDGAGNDDTEVLLRQPMAALRSIAAHLPHPELILDSAFEEHADKLCVPRQLSELLRRPLREVCDSFDAALDGATWRDVGIAGVDLQKWCMLYGHPLYLVGAARLLAYHEPAEQDGRIVACYMHDGHAYLYRDGRALKRFRSEPPRQERAVLEHEKKSQLEPWDQLKMYSGTPEPGLFFVSDLAWERRRMLESGRSPKVSLRDLTTVSQLSYQCVKAVDGCTGLCRIREEPPHASAMVEWLARLPVEAEYRGERLPALSLSVFLALLKAKRRTPSAEEQTKLLEQHDHRCAMCGGILEKGDLIWDHVAPLRQLSRLAPQRFQPICASCSEEKTALEGKQDRTLKSCFSKNAWESYVESPRPPPLSFVAHASQEGAGELFELDVRRCRRNALAHSAHDFSVFCPYDRIVPAETGKLCDYSFVKLPPTRKTKLTLLPTWGQAGTIEWRLSSSYRMRWPLGSISSGPSRRARTSTRSPWRSLCASWKRPGRLRRPGWQS